MGVDLTTYRRQIGAFYTRLNSCRKHKAKREKHHTYSRVTKGSDVHFRVFLMILLIGSQLITSETIMLCYRLFQHKLYEPEPLYLCSNIFQSGASIIISPMDYINHGTVTSSFDQIIATQYSSLCQRLLLLSSDVELNPGPMTDKEEILYEIRNSKNDVLREIKTVTEDINTIKEEVSGIKTAQCKIKSDVSDLYFIQSNLETRIADLETEVQSLKSDNEMLKQDNEVLQLDVDELNNDLETKTSIIESLDRDVDKLESYSRRDTLRIFGLPEITNETYENLKAYVISTVLNIACPDIKWHKEDIVRTHRVGKDSYDPDNPRILLIKFLHWDKKMAVLKGREKLREVGLRVGDDLTRRQRGALKQLSEKGQSGYFYKGKLHIRDKKKERSSSNEDSNDKIETRTFVKAFRKTIPVVSPDKNHESGSSNFVSQANIQTNISGGASNDIDSHDTHEDMHLETVDSSEK